MTRLQGRRVLVAEDWMLVAAEIESLLIEMGVEVVGPVASVAEALAVAREEPLDAALLDVNLDDREVYPVADELLLRGIPFAFMTGYSGESMPVEFQRWPRVEKPFDRLALESVLLRILFEESPAVRE